MLPKGISFSILSADTSFIEVEILCAESGRVAKVIDPHKVEEVVLYTLLESMLD